jgi:hypothetical protein
LKGRTSRREKVSKGSGHTMNPNGGVGARRGLEKPTQVTITRLRPGDLDEPPYADPLVGWCGGWGRKTPGYPISKFFNCSMALASVKGFPLGSLNACLQLQFEHQKIEASCPLLAHFRGHLQRRHRSLY